MSEIKHTALPWKFTPWHIEEDAASVRAPEGWAICFTSSDANAEFIVKACNAYYGNQSELAKLREENDRLRTGIKRLSDEEELCAETTGDDPFSMVYLAAKLASAESEIDRLQARMEALERSARLALDVQHERDVLAQEARRYASHYPEASDGRNTFVMFAEMIEARAALAKEPTP